MKQDPIAPQHSAWYPVVIGVMAAVVLVSAVVGFGWLPGQQYGVRFSGVWDAICSAAGLITGRAAREPVVAADHPTTTVALSSLALSDPSAQSVGRGATVALRCTMCHGARGVSDANTPNLAGQYADVTYKELVDFKTGARESAIMAPIVPFLTNQDMRDVAAYYASLTRPITTAEAPTIVESGAPLRSIAPCGACHGEIGLKPGAPWLEGEPVAYIRAQLADFASGARTNDIDEAMRNVARRMTRQEIDAASVYYGGHP